MLDSETTRYVPPSLNYQPNSEFSINGFFQRLDNYLGKFEQNIQAAEKDLEHQNAALITARQGLGQGFPHMALLEALRQDNREVMHELQISQKDPNYTSSWKPQSQAGRLPLASPRKPRIRRLHHKFAARVDNSTHCLIFWYNGPTVHTLKRRI